MSEIDQEIDVIVRGALVSGGNILLAHKIGGRNTFLPGGHIRKGEPAREALLREIKEEMGLDAEVLGYLGTVEHAWDEGGGVNHEIDLVFALSISGIDHRLHLASRESHTEFIWHPLEGLEVSRLEPSPLRSLLPLWLSEEKEQGWASTMER
ncbi:MAG: NUDIX domain-containing protein [bacterium]